MSATARGLVRAGVSAAAVLSVSACMPGGGSSSSSTSAAPPPATSSAAEAQPEITKPEQRELTPAQVRKALPPATEIGDGWVDNRVVPSTISYDPTSCGDLFLQGEQAKAFAKEHRVAEAKHDYVTDGTDADYLAVFVYSFDEPVPVSLLTVAGDAMGRCSTYDLVYSDGQTQSQETRGLQVPAVGDRSMGLATVSGSGSTLNRVTVLSGHSYVVVNYVGDRSDPGPLLRDVARTTLKRMSS
ncbi:hypothetical protein [Janibacter melonis]|uniref:hypothetical protein n=1 Tax=Janibacter melonis TaxID=262209 RepID=UPI00177EA872